MADKLPRIDGALALQAASVADSLRNVMLLCRELRTSDREITPRMVEIVEGLLFVVTVDLQAMSEKFRERLAEYDSLVTTISLLTSTADAFPIPPVPSSVIVFTGAYRPTPANDAAAGGAA